MTMVVPMSQIPSLDSCRQRKNQYAAGKHLRMQGLVVLHSIEVRITLPWDPMSAQHPCSEQKSGIWNESHAHYKDT